MNTDSYLKLIASYPDFPKKGILFRDIFPLVGNPKIFRQVIGDLAKLAETLKPDRLLAIEARGFIIGVALSLEMEMNMLPARKAGKLPGKTLTYEYALEYNTDTMQIPDGIIQPGEKVLVVDDVLATGGTALAAMKLVEMAKGKAVGLLALIELEFLKGAEKLKAHGYASKSVIQL